MSDNTQELREEWRNWLASHGLPHNEVEGDLILDFIEALIKSQTNQAVVEATRDSELIVSAIARQEGGKVTVSNSALVACSGKVMIEKTPPGIDGLLISELTQEVQTDE